MTIEELTTSLVRDVYAAAVQHFEAAEHARLIVGNGHHLAQDLAETAKRLLLERWAKKHAVNQGHGHVVPRADGARARCGGPGLCSVCAQEKAALEGKVAP